MSVRVVHKPVPRGNYAIRVAAQKAEIILKHKSLFDDILQGKYNAFFKYDIDEIAHRIENYDPLDNNEELKEFGKILTEVLNDKLFELSKISVLFKTLNELIFNKQEFLDKVESQKTYFKYDENDLVTNEEKITYKQFFETLEYAEKLLNNSNLYKVLKYFGKENATKELDSIKKRIEMFEIIERNTNIQSNKLLNAITNESPSDNKIGIIRICDSEKNLDSIYAGSRKELIISELIGKPYPKQMDDPGGDYGPHGDFYREPRKITHVFYDEPVTDSHRKLIEEKQQKVEKLKSTCRKNPKKYSEKGFIYSNGRVALVDQATLMLAGIDPKDVDWNPLKIRIKRELSSYDIVRATSSTKFPVINLVKAIMLAKELNKEGKNK